MAAFFGIEGRDEVFGRLLASLTIAIFAWIPAPASANTYERYVTAWVNPVGGVRVEPFGLCSPEQCQGPQVEITYPDIYFTYCIYDQ